MLLHSEVAASKLKVHSTGFDTALKREHRSCLASNPKMALVSLLAARVWMMAAADMICECSRGMLLIVAAECCKGEDWTMRLERRC